MRPVSVTFGFSSDELAIEACFERTILSDLGTSEEQKKPALSGAYVHSAEQRDDETLACLQISGNDDHTDNSSLREKDEESHEEDTITSREQPDPIPSASKGSQSDDNFIEAEYEMVLEDEEELSNEEKPAVQVEKACLKVEVTTDEEEEENVVVWCADASGSESIDSETERMDPIEEEGEIDDDNHPLDQEYLNDTMELSLSNFVRTEMANESEEFMSFPSAECRLQEEIPVASISDGQVDIGVKGEDDTNRCAKTAVMVQVDTDGSTETAIQGQVKSDRSEETTMAGQVDTGRSDETVVPTLSALINQRKWNDVIERINEFAHVTDVSLENQGSFLSRDSLGDSFLHEICKNQPTVEVIRLWLVMAKDDVKRSGIGGHLPLHYACAFGASLDVIDVLVQAFPESLITPDEHDKMLPLHFACREKAKVEVIDFLLEAHTEAIFAQDNFGMTPMDYTTGLQDSDARGQALHSIQNALKSKVTILSRLVDDSKITILEEQEKVKDLARSARAEKAAKEQKARDDHSLLEYALNRLATIEKSEMEQKNLIESLSQKSKTLESQLAEAQQHLSSEKTRFYIERTRQLESILKIEECKNSALEQSLVAKQEMVDNEKERTRDTEQKFSEMRILLQNEKLKTKRLEETVSIEKAKWRRLEEELAKNNVASVPKTRSDPPLGSNDAPTDLEIESQNAKGIELDRIRDESELKLEANREAIRALELGNAKKQEMIDTQQEKVELLERSRREKESLLQKSQETMKALEESIERKLSLQKTEEEKIRQLDNLRHKKREMIDSEEEQVRKLDYLLGRKQALLELEQMKEQILQQTIAQKQALLESEMTKLKELEAIYAEKEAILFSEQSMVKALQASKKEKEGLLRTGCELVNKLQHVNSEKETLLKKKQRIEEDIAKRVRAAEVMIAEEKKLLAVAGKVSVEKQALLLTTDVTIRDIELRTSKKSALMLKEQDIAESLERFRRRRYEVAKQGRLYSLVDTTLSISHLVKEALLAKKVERRLIEEQKPKARVIIRKQTVPPTSESFLRNAFNVKGKQYIHHFANYLGISPKWRKYTR